MDEMNDAWFLIVSLDPFGTRPWWHERRWPAGPRLLGLLRRDNDRRSIRRWLEHFDRNAQTGSSSQANVCRCQENIPREVGM
jgi:hypothetical protein